MFFFPPALKASGEKFIEVQGAREGDFIVDAVWKTLAGSSFPLSFRLVNLGSSRMGLIKFIRGLSRITRRNKIKLNSVDAVQTRYANFWFAQVFSRELYPVIIEMERVTGWIFIGRRHEDFRLSHCTLTRWAVNNSVFLRDSRRCEITSLLFKWLLSRVE